jgi:hypothetical protein
MTATTKGARGLIALGMVLLLVAGLLVFMKAPAQAQAAGPTTHWLICHNGNPQLHSGVPNGHAVVAGAAPNFTLDPHAKAPGHDEDEFYKPSNDPNTYTIISGIYSGTTVGTWTSGQTCLGVDPAIALTKTGAFANDGDGDGVPEAGETISYTFTVDNTGNEQLTNVSVTDSKVAVVTCPGGNPIPTLAPGAAVTCTGSYTLTQADIDAGQVINTATATGTTAAGGTVSDSDSVTVLLAQTASIQITKAGVWNDAPVIGVAEVGETISYTFVVTNDGNVTLTNVSVTDTKVAVVTCPGGNPIPTLAPGTANAVTCTGSYTLTQADIDAGQVINTATATASPVSDTDSDTTSLTTAASVQLVKTGVWNDAPIIGVAEVGETISYTFVVTNDGNLTLTDVSVTDSKVAVVTCPGGNPIPTLAPGAAVTCTGTYVLTAIDVSVCKVDNTALAEGKDPAGAVVQDTDSETVGLPGCGGGGPIIVSTTTTTTTTTTPSTSTPSSTTTSIAGPVEPTTTTVAGPEAPTELPNTGPPSLVTPIGIGAFGLLLAGAGLFLFASRRRLDMVPSSAVEPDPSHAGMPGRGSRILTFEIEPLPKH